MTEPPSPPVTDCELLGQIRATAAMMVEFTKVVDEVRTQLARLAHRVETNERRILDLQRAVARLKGTHGA